jgi:hypothetical protein
MFSFKQHRNPPPLPKWTSLYLPFTPKMWIATIITVLLSTLFIYCYGVNHPSAEYLPSELVFKSLGIIVDSSQSLKLISPVTRIFFGVFIMGFFVISVGYKGALISVLSLPHDVDPLGKLHFIIYSCPCPQFFDFPVDTLEDFANSVDPIGSRVCIQRIYITNYHPQIFALYFICTVC